MLRRPIWSSIAVLVLWLTVAGCSRLLLTPEQAFPATDPGALANGSVVDGHHIGHLLDCSTTCEDALAIAKTSAVSTRDLDPNAITRVRVYVPFIPAGATTSGGGYVVVYDLFDGSRMAIRVHCGVGGCQVVPPQPIDPPPPVDYSCNGSVCIQCQGSVCTPWLPPSPGS
jgi:hypothetical protein